MRAKHKLKPTERMRVIEINNFYINTNILNDISKKNLKKVISLLKHEIIHTKIFNLFKIKKTEIYIFLQEIDGINYLHGRCKPLEIPHIYLVPFMVLFHFIYDIIYDILDLNFKKLKEHIRDFLSDLSPYRFDGAIY